LNEQRFWSKIDKKGPDDCWAWRRGGYGQFRLDGNKVYAHRLAYCLHHKIELAEIVGKCVCHACDNPPCCNPEHLWLGTQADNLRDSSNKGRVFKGEKHCKAKLKNDDVRLIRVWLKCGYKQKPIANAFGVDQAVISRIKTGRGWKHIEDLEKRIEIWYRGQYVASWPEDNGGWFNEYIQLWDEVGGDPQLTWFPEGMGCDDRHERKEQA